MSTEPQFDSPETLPECPACGQRQVVRGRCRNCGWRDEPQPDYRDRWCKGCNAVVPVILVPDRDAWACASEHITSGLDLSTFLAAHDGGATNDP